VTTRHLELAGQAVGFMPDDEGRALYQAALDAGKTGLGPVVEIGTYRGKSALYLGAAASEVGFLVFSIDHHRGSEENQPGWEHHDPTIVDRSTGQIDTLPFARRTVADAGLERDVVLVVGDSARVASAWSTPLSMLFIDGGHGSDVEWGDYRSWAPKVAPGGLLAVHDVFADPADGGRPPYEIFCHAVESALWQEVTYLSCGSLRVLRRDDGEAVGRP
jgi:MMP 1-O-methyltransferase